MNETEQQRTRYYRTTFTGQMVAECNDCGTVCVYWDTDDLDDNGDLPCKCWGLD